MRDGPPIFGFTGPSGAGKTTLLESLIRDLVAGGLAVGVVKRAPHHIEVDRPGKDSQRVYEAGAQAVALAGPDRIVTFARHEPDPPSLAEAIAALPDHVDVVLVEGYLSEPIPRYVVVPAGAPDSRDYRSAARLLGVIEVPKRAAGEPPRFDAALVKQIVDEIRLAIQAGDSDS